MKAEQFVPLLLKSSGVSAASAQRLDCFPPGKTAVQHLRPGGGQNLFHGLLQKISQSNVTLVIKAAGDNSSVTKDTKLIPKAVTEHIRAAFLSG